MHAPHPNPIPASGAREKIKTHGTRAGEQHTGMLQTHPLAFPKTHFLFSALVALRSGGRALRGQMVFVIAREDVDARRRHLDDARGE